MSTSIKHWQDPVNIALGAWMAVSPWVLAYQTQANATRNAVILGIAIAAIALFAVLKVRAWEEWTNLVLGVWLVISPWVLDFSAMYTAMWNAVIVGLAVALLALWTLATDRDIGGWWRPAT